jgi:hypothetical protein
MPYAETDRDFIAAVSQVLGESRSLIRSRGFQMIEILVFDDGESLPDGVDLPAPDDATEDDAVDLATVAGLDWDGYDDSRLHRRSRGRCRRRVA